MQPRRLCGALLFSSASASLGSSWAAPADAGVSAPNRGSHHARAGVNSKALSTYMGHSSITITLDRYGHLLPGNESEAAQLLDTWLKNAISAGKQSRQV